MKIKKTHAGYKDFMNQYFQDEFKNINNWYYLIGEENYSDIDDLNGTTRKIWLEKMEAQYSNWVDTGLDHDSQISGALSLYNFERDYKYFKGDPEEGLKPYLAFIKREIQEHEAKIRLMEEKTSTYILSSETSPCYIEEDAMFFSDGWLYQDAIYRVDGVYSDDEIRLIILEFVDKERQKFEKLRNKFTGRKSEELKYERTRISEEVRIEVWRRDQGKCARCGSRENLEYDHIVPVSKGGSNTARNIELLCQNCNRAKGNRIE